MLLQYQKLAKGETDIALIQGTLALLEPNKGLVQ